MFVFDVYSLRTFMVEIPCRESQRARELPRISNSAVLPAAAPPSAGTFLFCQFSQQFGVCSSAVVRETTLYEGSCCIASTVSDGFSPSFTLSPLLLSLYWNALPGTDFTCKKKLPLN